MTQPDVTETLPDNLPRSAFVAKVTHTDHASEIRAAWGKRQRSTALPPTTLPRTTLPHRGMALLVVLVLTTLVALAAYHYTFTMESEYRISRVYEEQTQARLSAMSGIELAAAILEQPVAMRGTGPALSDNAEWFHAVPVNAAADPRLDAMGDNHAVSGGALPWSFSLVSPLLRDAASPGSDGSASATSPRIDERSASYRFGLQNEAAKLHIPTLLAWDAQVPGHAKNTLMNLPRATEASVDAWLQSLPSSPSARPLDGSWPISDSSAGMSGQLPAASFAPGRISTIQDQLNYLWLGGDLNQNYVWDPLERKLDPVLPFGFTAPNHTSESQSTLAVEPAVPIGWKNFLTWHSGHRNENIYGQPRIYLNEPDLTLLHQRLLSSWPVEWANFVIAYRQFGATRQVRSLSATPPATWIPDLSTPAAQTLTSVLELVDIELRIPASTGQGELLLASPISTESVRAGDDLERLLDEATVSAADVRIGQIDVTQAPEEVLVGALGGMSRELAKKIVQSRAMRPTDQASRGTIAWLLEAKLVNLDQLRALEPFLTARSDVYSVQAIGYRDARSAVCRCTVTIDATQVPAALRHPQFWQNWDRGFPIDQWTAANLNPPVTLRAE